MRGVDDAARRIRSRKQRVLGDAVAVCPRCGYARRYMLELGDPPPDTCPDCSTALIVGCPACGEPLESAMQVACRICEAPLRPEESEAFGVQVRRKPEPRGRAVWEDDEEPPAPDGA